MLSFKQKKSGFTLIELLVVISIIAVLMAIMMPALARAREQARDVMCKAHLRGLAEGYHIYAAEYEGYIAPYDKLNGKHLNPDNFSSWMAQIGVSPRAGNQTFSYRSTVVATIFFNTGQILTDNRSWHWPQANSGTAGGDIVQFVTEKLSCPTTRGKKTNPTSTNPDGHGYHVTYAINSDVDGWRTTNIRRPAETVLLTDVAAVNNTVNSAIWISSDDWPGVDTVGRIGRWHGAKTMDRNPWSDETQNGIAANNRSFNVAFVDGRVAQEKDEYSLTWRRDGTTREPASQR